MSKSRIQYCRDCIIKEDCLLFEYPKKVESFGSTMQKNYCPFKKREKKAVARKPRTTQSGKTTGELKEELWKVFRDYIVYRDNLTCITCGRKENTLNRLIMQCGHFISKQQYSVFKFEPKNNNCQCSNCNRLTFDRGVAWYSHKVVEKYGMETHKWLTENAFWGRPFEDVYGFSMSKDYLKEQISLYKKLLKEEKARFERQNF